MAEFEKSSTRQPWPSCHSEKFPRAPQKCEIAQNNEISLEYMQLFILVRLRCADVGT